MKNYIQKLITPVLMSSVWADLMLAFPRIIGCFFLAKNFGGSKFPTPDWFVQDVSKFGGIFALFPTFFAWAAVLAETFGGALLVVGLGTRFAGFLVTSTMLVAIFCQKMGWRSVGNVACYGLFVDCYLCYGFRVGSFRFGLFDFKTNE